MTQLKSLFEQKIEKIKEELSDHVSKKVEQACTSYLSEELPFLETDYEQNVEIRAQEIIRDFLEDKEPKDSLGFHVFDLVKRRYDVDKIRKKILEDNKEKLAELISADLMDENERLIEENMHLRKRLNL